MPDTPHRPISLRSCGDTVVEARGVVLRYGDVVALAGVDLSVAPGTVLVALGPNGAGKSSLVECLIGYRRPTSGTVRVLGSDPWRAGPTWRARIGVVLQDSRTDADLTVREYLRMVAGYYGPTADPGAAATATGLVPHLRQRVHKLSGGQRRRLELAVALVGNPELFFLDEPTSGLDPEARRELWRVVSQQRDSGRTVVLTTHRLDEAEALADRVVMIDRGRIVHDGTVDEIRAKAGLRSAVRFSCEGDSPITGAISIGLNRWEIVTDDVSATLKELASLETELQRIDVQAPTFEDVYLRLLAEASEASEIPG